MKPIVTPAPPASEPGWWCMERCNAIVMKLDQATVKTLLDGIASGLPKEYACNNAGISKTTFYNWLKEGETHIVEGTKSLKRKLAERLPFAEAENIRHHVMHINVCSETEWRASAWFLERSHPAHFGKRLVMMPPQEHDKLTVIN
jgi:hypothetical protein